MPPPAPTLRDYIDALIPSSDGKKYDLADIRRMNKSEGRTMKVLCWDSPVMEFENTSDTDEYTPADRRRDLLANDLGVTLVLDHKAGGKLDVRSFVDYAATVDGTNPQASIPTLLSSPCGWCKPLCGTRYPMLCPTNSHNHP